MESYLILIMVLGFEIQSKIWFELNHPKINAFGLPSHNHFISIEREKFLSDINKWSKKIKQKM